VDRIKCSVTVIQGPVRHLEFNALGQKESWQYDPRFGQQPTSHSGPNGLTTPWSYDRFGRKISEVRADGMQTQFAYLFCSGVNGGTAICPVEILVYFMTPSVSSDADHLGDPAIKVYGIIDRDNNIRTTCLYTATDRSPSSSRKIYDPN
jgi:YD repeat-containing protein